MRKIVLTGLLVLCLVLGIGVAAMAESGFHIGAGYEEMNNTISASANLTGLGIPIPNLGIDLSTPARMYSVDLGYDFNDNFAINGKFSWGSTDLAKGYVSVYPAISANVPFTQDNQYWNVEAVYKVPVSDNFKIGGIVGYADSRTTLKGSLNYAEPGYSLTGSGELKQSFNGAYIGLLVAVNPTSNFEIGAAYRYLLGPTGNMDVSANYNDGGSTGSYYHSYSLNDLHVSNLDVYGKYTINKNWSAKMGYTYNWTDYNLNVASIPVDVTNKTGSLYVKMEYKF